MKVLIADDHAVVRTGLRKLLESFPKAKQIEEAGDGQEALGKIRNDNYDMVILDISLPGINGLDILQQLKQNNSKTRFLVMSFMPEEVYANKAIKLGASGYLMKGASNDEVKKAIHKVLEGGKYISEAMAESIVFNKNNKELPHEKLSEREFQIFLMLARGRRVKEIAEIIYISDKTVSTHRTRIMRKMNMSSNAELTLYAIDHKLLV